jgi:hypothetical protein
MTGQTEGIVASGGISELKRSRISVHMTRVLSSGWLAASSHPISAAFSVALLVRVIAAVAITIHSGYLFPDEQSYVTLGHLAATGQLDANSLAGFGQTLFREAASFMWPVTFLFWIFGDHILVAALWAALFGAVTAVLTALLVSRVLGKSWAALAGLAAALFPSQILWSSVVLRESMVWAGLAGAAFGVTLLGQAENRRSLLGAAVLIGVSLFDLAFLREWAFVAGLWATGLSIWLFRPARPVLARGICLVLWLTIPLAQGYGPGAVGLLNKETGLLGYERSVLSIGAQSAFVHPPVVRIGYGRSGLAVGAKSALVPPPVGSTQRKTRTGSAVTPATATSTPTSVIPLAISGEGYLVNNGIRGDIRELPRGAIAFLFRPIPGQHGDGLSYDFASFEELLYYPLYVLALIGVFAYRRRRDIIGFAVLVIIGITGIAADTEGNLGSAFRHRDQLLWAFVLLATLGVAYLRSRYIARRSAHLASD